MIASLRGYVQDIGETSVVIDVNGIGFDVQVSGDTAARLADAKKDEEVMIYTFMNVDREGAMSLFGFNAKDDLDLFKKLITVSGVGPKGALSLLSALGADGLRFAIVSGDAKTIAKAPGVGKKTAERLCIDLRDKLEVRTFENLDDTTFAMAGNVTGLTGDSEADDAIEALAALGYPRAEATKAVKKARADGIEDTEGLLRAGLTYLA